MYYILESHFQHLPFNDYLDSVPLTLERRLRMTAATAATSSSSVEQAAAVVPFPVVPYPIVPFPVVPYPVVPYPVVPYPMVVVDEVVVVVVEESLDLQRCPGPLTQIVTEGTFTQNVLNVSTKVATNCISPEEAALHLRDTDVLRLLTRPEMSKFFSSGNAFSDIYAFLQPCS